MRRTGPVEVLEGKTECLASSPALWRPAVASTKGFLALPVTLLSSFQLHAFPFRPSELPNLFSKSVTSKAALPLTMILIPFKLTKWSLVRTQQKNNNSRPSGRDNRCFTSDHSWCRIPTSSCRQSRSSSSSLQFVWTSHLFLILLAH